jgi:ketosteroid isomerase-like protein
MASSSEEIAIRAVASRFFDAIEAGDINTMYDTMAPACEVWHNYDEIIVDREFTKRLLGGMVQRIANVKYSHRRIVVYPGGFCQQHILLGTRKDDGQAVRLPAALICKVENDKISRIDDYLDSAQSAEFRKKATQPNI